MRIESKIYPATTKREVVVWSLLILFIFHGAAGFVLPFMLVTYVTGPDAKNAKDKE